MVAEHVVVAKGLVSVIGNFFDEVDSDREDGEGWNQCAGDVLIECRAFLRSSGKDGILERRPMHASHQVHDDRGMKVVCVADFRGK